MNFVWLASNRNPHIDNIIQNVFSFIEMSDRLLFISVNIWQWWWQESSNLFQLSTQKNDYSGLM